MALKSEDREKFYEILQTPCLEISHCIDEFAVPLYYHVMKEDLAECKVKYSVLSLRLSYFLEIKVNNSFKSRQFFIYCIKALINR